MKIRGNRFLVIGGAGFIGSHLVDQLLAEGASLVRIYDNFSRGTRENLVHALADNRTEIFPDGGDILHRDTLRQSMKDIDGIFHLAALWLLQCYEYPRSAFDVNVQGTMNVFEEAIAEGIGRLVFSSSASVYGDAIAYPMDENHPFNCQEFYGATKVCGEMLLRALGMREQKKGNNFKFVGLRYMNVYGMRQDDKGAYVGVISKMLAALDADIQPVIFGDGTQSYDFIDVRDCARANIQAMRAESTNEFYNIGTGIKTSVTALAEILISLHESKLTARYEPADRTFVQNRIGSTQLAREQLGFGAKIDLKQGLKDYIRWRQMSAREGGR